ncbi:flagellar basal body-associated FliL family protein [Gilvimarinus algae]|uniref:Flagellar protein FliL n=1 Tax=Gilvimarinus algae TaxID=3058037 RepID=A0ABT8TJR0_9GAMM|nr:flagellar basal body-associated FliL family protein [Gilvimarinus sp. SDUM040014]MDO3382587.1 flagellar basal body-associated FliL family protein [Gilvimarinus sp. SDUM040014]
MADNDRKDLDDDEENSAEDQEKTGGGKKKWIIIGVVALLLIVVSVVGTLFLLGTFDESEPAAEGEEVAAAEEAEVPAIQPAIYYPLKPEFVTNYEVRGRQRYMQVEMSFMLRDNDVVAAIELHMPAIRNALVMLMRGQSYEELQTAEGKELLRQQALLKVQEVLQQEIGKPGIEQVLFTNLVLQ